VRGGTQVRVLHYLQNHPIIDLHNNFGIKVKEYADRFVLNYDQIASADFRFEPVVMECRNLILSRDYKVLHRSFDRFFNYGEDPDTDKFDISKCHIDEKLDGSLIGFYHDGIAWNFCTRQSAFAEGYLPEKKITYAQLIQDVPGIEKLYGLCRKEYSYIFEIVSPKNRVLTPYQETKLVLLAVRNKETGDFLDREREAQNIHWDVLPKTYAFKSFDGITQAVKELPVVNEGYVCKTENNWFLKIKNPAYVALSLLHGNNGISPNNILRLVRNFDESEYLSYFPEDRQYFEGYFVVRDNMEHYFQNLYEKYRHIENQKDFALAIQDVPFKHILFSMRQGISFKDIRITESNMAHLYNYFLDDAERMRELRAGGDGVNEEQRPMP
jgi:T4 RnlA family RNA ligase